MNQGEEAIRKAFYEREEVSDTWNPKIVPVGDLASAAEHDLLGGSPSIW
jgi:hypothetical protein